MHQSELYLLYLVMKELFFLEYSDTSAGSFPSTMGSGFLRSPFGEPGSNSIVSPSSLGRLLSVGLPRCLNCTPLGLVMFTVESRGRAVERQEHSLCQTRPIAWKFLGQEKLELVWTYCGWHVKE